MWTSTSAALNSMTFPAFTIEATFKLENGGYRTLVGRDSKGAATASGDINGAALYLQALPNNGLAIKFTDVAGYWHEAISANNVFTSFAYATDPTGALAPWYSVAAVSDGSKLSLYLRDMNTSVWTEIASNDMTTGTAVSTNTAMTAGTGDGGDWDAGNFSVGRGLYNGGHGDRAWGYIDEVRISNAALPQSKFLMAVPEPGTCALAGLGVLAFLRRRRSA